MKFLSSLSLSSQSGYPIGGKAAQLQKLGEMGFEVPKWGVIPATELINRLPFGYEELPPTELLGYIEHADIPETVLAAIGSYFQESIFLAVRSSAIGEDGENHSFAGQFESYLYVPKEEVDVYIKKVWASAFSDRVRSYSEHRGTGGAQPIAVIIQAMVPAEVSGVAFGINPLSGNRQEQVVNAVYGLGEGVVSGKLDADQFIIRGAEIEKRIAEKTHRFSIDWQTGRGTRLETVDRELQRIPALTDEQVRAVCELLKKGERLYGVPLDMEFAWVDDTLYVLQARPVTGLEAMPDTSGEYTLWDNSNIIESYPGVTTPLTFSFVSKSYAGAYRLFCAYLGVSKKVLDRHGHVFANTLGLIKGRIYYNLKTWYHMLSLLPGYRINARYMEKMMGVKARFDLPESERQSKWSAWGAIFGMACKMVWRFLTLPLVRRRFVRLLDRTISEYKRLDLQDKDAHRLMRLYLDFERRLLNEWKAPLLNDFFAMIAFGTLEKQVKKWTGDTYPNLHNDLLCGSADIISTQPIHRCLAIAGSIAQTREIRDLFLREEPRAIWNQLQRPNESALRELKGQMDSFLDDFGERCVGELKLETVSYTQDPARFIRLIQSYVKGGMTAASLNRDVEERLRKDAENVMTGKLKGKPMHRWFFNRLLKTTRRLVSARENLRYERTRAFGVVRQLMVQLGKRFQEAGIVDRETDVFYLTMDELFAYIEGRSVTEDMKFLIALRTAEFKAFKQSAPPPERFATYGVVHRENTFTPAVDQPLLSGDLQGVGCCPGRVKARVRVILDPEGAEPLDGDILVTRSTDPGWTTLFPAASGILVERGSLLSHSAIVSREMGKPCIVGITGLLNVLQTGDWVEMDGSTGQVKRIEGHGNN